MPLAALTKMLACARLGGYAICYCESWNLESLQAVIEAAEECRSPIIAGFNGGFLRHSSRSKPENLAYYAGLRLALEKSSVPIAFLLNESDSLAQIEESIALGFNAVMPENEGLPLDRYRDLVNAVVTIAHPRSVCVEAQIGILPSGTATHNGRCEITDPGLAQEFVDETGIDALAVSIGNVHVLTLGKASVDLEALRRVRERVQIPLVVHGGTSLPPECVPRLIDLGVAKFNFGTVLKQQYLDAVRQRLVNYHSGLSPHAFLGMGGDQDIMIAGREAVRKKVKELINICGSKNKVNL